MSINPLSFLIITGSSNGTLSPYITSQLYFSSANFLALNIKFLPVAVVLAASSFINIGLVVAPT